MSPSSSKKSRKRSHLKTGGDGKEAANIAAVQQSAKRSGRRRVASKEFNAVHPASGQLDDNTSGNMFCGNIAISGGQFVQAENVIHNNQPNPFELLQRRVAHSAFHNSAVRIDPPRCHPDTRVEILQSIYDWIIQSESRQQWLLWLNGAAGAGKSAIMQSIAERCIQAGIVVASFFFFRTDSTRNNTTSLIATLSYQLIQAIPETSSNILLAIKHNPLIFKQSLELQLQFLIIQPLLHLPINLQRLFVVLIDGLDECNDRAHQTSLIKLLATVSRGQNCPILFLISSRRDPQLEAAFLDRQIAKSLRTMSLDNSDIEQTSEDIRHFLNNRFTEIKETHLRKHLLPRNWPHMSAVEEIVSTSSGQFIYASVVINYVSSPRGNPAHLLEVIRGIRLRDPSSQNPFAHLDALYGYIFSQVESLDKVLDILAYVLITKTYLITDIMGAFMLEEGELEVYFSDLTAVINCKLRWCNIKFLHASLPDFLRDKTRSERYYIDVEKYLPKLLCMFLDRTPTILDPLSQPRDTHAVSWQEYSRLYAIKKLLAKGAKASDQLRSSFMTFSVVFYEDNFRILLIENVIGILKNLKKLNFNDQGQVYQHVLKIFAAELAKFWPLLDRIDRARVIDTPDLLASMNQF